MNKIDKFNLVRRKILHCIVDEYDLASEFDETSISRFKHHQDIYDWLSEFKIHNNFRKYGYVFEDDEKPLTSEIMSVCLDQAMDCFDCDSGIPKSMAPATLTEVFEKLLLKIRHLSYDKFSLAVANGC